MGRLREGAFCLMVMVAVVGCGKAGGVPHDRTAPVRLSAASPFAPGAQGKPRKTFRKGSISETELVRLFVEEPPPGAAALIEAQQDFTFLSRLSPKEQVLYAELVSE